MRICLPAILILAIISCSLHRPDHVINTVSLLDEMVDLNRLTRLPEDNYRTIQFSSYDRRSTRPTDTCWFSNEDGFGNEPVPAFIEVLKKPGADGTGEYLICDVKQPGAVIRLWTAGINGKIRLFLDNIKSPVYDGDAQDFFWKTAEKLSEKYYKPEYSGIFRQFDATYFPLPFAKRCRIEWTGDIKKIHFYHVGIRVYDPGVIVETFNPEDFESYSQKILEVNDHLKNPDVIGFSKEARTESFESEMTDSLKKELFFSRGMGAIKNLSFRIAGSDLENALRMSILNIYFDGSSIPQVQAPLGDFFGSAPGLNQYNSLPFGVMKDSTLICRFIMPFKKSVRIEIENHSGKEIKYNGSVTTDAYKWEDGKTMHFRARWKIDHGLTASFFDSGNNDIQDILYLMASGQGRVVGAAAFIYNPSNATTSWGNWWGEGDEKIFVDRDTFPSFFGTGSEDYFNYSWSSQKIFSFPYCGQSRNDGPGNRGYVSDYRWHISDDIPFRDKIAFYMELGHHGVVPGFSYGRIVYFYALPGVLDDFRKISIPDIKYLPYVKWDPISYLGSAAYRYIQAEKLIAESSTVKSEKGKLWADGSIIMWKPVVKGERIRLNVKNDSTPRTTTIGLTLAHMPEGGTISVFMNGRIVRFDDNQFIKLSEPVQTTLVNHFSEPVALKKGTNEVILESIDGNLSKKIGIDFLWVKKF
jgi:hypothetical protein